MSVATYHEPIAPAVLRLHQMCNKNIQKRDKKKTQLLCRRCNQDPNMDVTQFWTIWFNITNTIYQITCQRDESESCELDPDVYNK